MASASRDDVQDAALQRLDEALRTQRIAEASGWSDYLVQAARDEVTEARVALEAVRQAWLTAQGEP